jgi:hypothetical protein
LTLGGFDTPPAEVASHNKFRLAAAAKIRRLYESTMRRAITTTTETVIFLLAMFWTPGLVFVGYFVAAPAAGD